MEGSLQLCDVRIRCDLDYLEEARGQSQRDVRVGADVRMHGELDHGAVKLHYSMCDDSAVYCYRFLEIIVPRLLQIAKVS
jgi:hypothetical protein